MEGKIEVEFSDIRRDMWTGQPWYPRRGQGAPLPAQEWHWRAWVILDDGTEVRAGAGSSSFRSRAIRLAKKAVKKKIRKQRYQEVVKARAVSQTFKI